VTFWGTNYTPWLEIGQTVQQDLATVGIRMKALAQPVNAWLAAIVKNPAGITENQWELPYPHGSYVMDGGFTRAALKSGCCNFSNFTNSKFDALAQEAHRATSTPQVVRLYKEMDRIVVKDEALWVPLFYPKYAELTSKRVRGVILSPSAPSR